MLVERECWCCEGCGVGLGDVVVVDGDWVVTVLLFGMNSRVLGLGTRKGKLGFAGFSCFRGVLHCSKERGGIVVFGSLLFTELALATLTYI